MPVHRQNGSFGPHGDGPAANGQVFYTGGGREGAPTNGTTQSDVSRASATSNALGGKNTKHVPCKFFRQGTCQAGNACPFSHSIDPMMHQAPCKYFMKGNCKFGAKCALAHYLPNGQRVTRANLNAGIPVGGRNGFAANNRSPASPYMLQDIGVPDPYAQQPFAMNPDYFPGEDQFPLLDDEADAYNGRYSGFQMAPGFDSTVGSPPTSQFGSPPGDNLFQKLLLDNRRSALNAPMPASFDANSLPYIAKYGPFGASVPDKFGMRSPASSSLPRRIGSPPGSSILMKNSTIGLSLRNVSSPVSLSPQPADESIGQRTMHSQKQTRPRIISASLPRTMLDDWEEDTGLESDLLPNSLHDEVLLPQEKMRRLSRAEPELSSSAKSGGLSIPRRSSNVGSPPTGSSPSRFRAFFEEQRKKEESLSATSPNFGHVGSPLRESWMPHDTAEAGRGPQISGISQAMARMELHRTESIETNGSARPGVGVRNSSHMSRLDRAISSPGLNGRKIDEEGEGGLFEMDDESSKRNSNSAWTIPQSFPRLTIQDSSPISPGDVNNEPHSRAGGSRAMPMFGFQR